ncbi:hypothetical protein [Streptomyces sp. NPDC001380]|uniref:hypothetical protein n=1 Tax=Streptomyces sp. NPDC001380 TaxID=3364566 RepID=UPI0036876CDE
MDRPAPPSPDARNDREALLDRLREVDDRVALIERYLDALDEQQALAPEPDPQPWTARADADQWTELADWVDWLVDTYRPAGEHRVPACWPAHPGAAEHLAALHTAWRGAMAKETAEPGLSEASAYWHDRFLWPLLARVRAMVPNDCLNLAHRPPDPPDPTDRNLLPQMHTSAY